MTSPLETTPATGTAPASAPPQAQRIRPGRGNRLLHWWLLGSVAVALALAAAIVFGIGHVDLTPLHVVVDGTDVTSGLTIDAPGATGKLLAVAILFMVALVLVMMVPLLVLLVVGAVAVALVLGFGVPLVVLALALAVVTSPLWLVALGLWALLRRRGPAPAVTMHA